MRQHTTSRKLRVLVTGAHGQVGAELARCTWPTSVDVATFGSAELDITDRRAVLNTTAEVTPDVIVNAAAYTAVDKAESEPERALAVNATGVQHLADAANTTGAMLVHISTDYVFDGTKDGWYTEEDQRNPLGVYGETKSLGEDAALSAERSIVLRTAWVYGALGANFVATMLRLASEREELGVVDDQVGCPTAAGDIARAVVAVIEATDGGRSLDSATGRNRVFHLTSPTDVSWFEFANLIFKTSKAGFNGRCRPLSTDEYPTPAARPANSRLDATLLHDTFGLRLPELTEALGPVLAEMETGR